MLSSIRCCRSHRHALLPCIPCHRLHPAAQPPLTRPLHSSFSPSRLSVPVTSQVDPSTLNAIHSDILSRQSSGRPLDSASTRITLNSIVSQFRKLVHDGVNPIPLAEQCCAAYQQNLLGHISYDLLIHASNVLGKQIKRNQAQSHDRPILEQASIALSVHNAPRALYVCLQSYLSKQDANAVIDLFNRYLTLASTPIDNTLPQSVSPPLTKDRPHLPSDGHSQTLTIALGAYALKDSFDEAVAAYQRANIKLNYAVAQSTVDATPLPSVKERWGLYLERVELAALVSNPFALSKRIARLSRQGLVKDVIRLYTDIISAMTTHDAYIANNLESQSKSKPCSVTEVGWNAFLAAFMKSARSDLGERLWDDLSRIGIPIGTSLWNTLIDFHASHGALDEALATWQMMARQGVKPDGLSNRAVISAYFKSRKPVEALNHFRAYQRDGMPNCDQHTQLTIYNTVLNGLLHSRRSQEATRLLKEMETKGPTPDVVCYNTFLSYFGFKGDLTGLADTIGRMNVAKVKGDVVTFLTILSSLLKAGRDDALDMVLRVMRQQNVEPNEFIFTSIIKEQMISGGEDGYGMAMRILQRMEDHELHQPSEVTYTTILAGIVRARYLTANQKEEESRKTIDRMQTRGIKLTERAYNILIDACLNSDGVDATTLALTYFHDMQQQRLAIQDDTWVVLLSGLIRKEQWDLAREVSRAVVALKQRPDRTLDRLVSLVEQKVDSERKYEQ
jgi:pentatricopeptide repeat protein